MFQSIKTLWIRTKTMFYLATPIIRTVFRTIHIFHGSSRHFVKWICDYLDDFLEEEASECDTTAISTTLNNHQKDDIKSLIGEMYEKTSDVLCKGNSSTKEEYFKTVATKSEINKSVEGDVNRIESLDATDYDVLNSKMHIPNLNICFHGSVKYITSKLNNAKTVTLLYKFLRENIEIISGDCIQNKASNSPNNGVESEKKTSLKSEPRICVTVCNSDINKELLSGNKITQFETNNSRAHGKETDIINSYNNISLKFDELEPKTLNHTNDFGNTITVKNHDENLKSVDSKETEIPYGRFFQEKKQFSDNFSCVSMEPENSGETVLEMDEFELRVYESYLNACNVFSETTCCLPTKENTECLKNGTTLASQMNESPKMSRDSKKLFSKDLNALTLGADNQQNKNKIFEKNIDLMECMIDDRQVRNDYDPICNLEMSYESQLNNEVETKDLLCTTAVCDSGTQTSTPNNDFKKSSRKIPMTTSTETSTFADYDFEESFDDKIYMITSSESATFSDYDYKISSDDEISTESFKKKCDCRETETVSSSGDKNLKSCKPRSLVQHESETHAASLKLSPESVVYFNKNDIAIRRESKNSNKNMNSSATLGSNNSPTKPSKEISIMHEDKPTNALFHDKETRDKFLKMIYGVNLDRNEIENNSNNITNSTISESRGTFEEISPCVHIQRQWKQYLVPVSPNMEETAEAGKKLDTKENQQKCSNDFAHDRFTLGSDSKDTHFKRNRKSRKRLNCLCRTSNDESMKMDSRVPLETSAAYADESEKTNSCAATETCSLEFSISEKSADEPNSDRCSNSKSCPSGTLNQDMKHHGPAITIPHEKNIECGISQNLSSLEISMKTAAGETRKGSKNKNNASQGGNLQFATSKHTQYNSKTFRRIFKNHKLQKSPEDPLKSDPMGCLATSNPVNDQRNDVPPLNMESEFKERHASQQSFEGGENPSGKISSQYLESKKEIRETSSTSFGNTGEENSDLSASLDNYSQRKKNKKKKKKSSRGNRKK